MADPPVPVPTKSPAAASQPPQDAPPKAAPRVLTPEEAAKGYVRPHRDAVTHQKCGIVSILRRDVAQAFAKTPTMLSRVRCTACRGDFDAKDFVWSGSKEAVGS
jgi:hypothetical protein